MLLAIRASNLSILIMVKRMDLLFILAGFNFVFLGFLGMGNLMESFLFRRGFINFLNRGLFFLLLLLNGSCASTSNSNTL